MRVRETSGTEGEAKKEIRDIYTHNINKYIFLYLLSRGKLKTSITEMLAIDRD